MRYRTESPALIIHCRHSNWCQRETGASLVLNAVIESDRVSILEGQLELVLTAT